MGEITIDAISAETIVSNCKTKQKIVTCGPVSIEAGESARSRTLDTTLIKLRAR